jgi:hypothetical protein
MAGYPEVILPIWLGGWLRFRKAVQKSLLGDVVTSCRAVLPQMIERLSYNWRCFWHQSGRIT